MREDDIIEAVKKKKRSRPGKTEEFKLQVAPGEMSQMIQNAMAVANLPDIDTNDNEQVRRRIGEYFQICADRDMKPSVSGMALALGVDRMTLWNWANGNVKSKPREVVDTVKKAHIILNNLMEEYMQNGKINPVVGIFLSKNNFGYTDRTEIAVAPANPLGDVSENDISQIEAKYRASVPPPDEGDGST